MQEQYESSSKCRIKEIEKLSSCTHNHVDIFLAAKVDCKDDSLDPTHPMSKPSRKLFPNPLKNPNDTLLPNQLSVFSVRPFLIPLIVCKAKKFSAGINH